MSTYFHGDVAITGGDRRALVSFSSVKKNNKPEVTSVILQNEHSSLRIASWGANNDYPQQLLNSIKPTSAAKSALRVSRKAHYGSGFIFAKESVKDGKRLIEQASILEYPEINAFWKRNQMSRFWRETILDLEYFAIAFPEYILSNDYKTINRVKRQKAAHCRFSLMDEDSRSIKYIHISSKWDEGISVDSKYVETVQAIDSYWSAEEVKEYCKKHKIRKFIRPIFYPLINESYYPDPEWHSALHSGWVEIANSIPTFKKNFLKNQLNIKFHIQVSDEYFKRKYTEDWIDFTPEKREEIRTDFVETLDEALRDNENAGKSIMSIIYKDENGNPQDGLKITTIDNNAGDGAFLKDTSAGNQEILTAIGVDPSLIGAGIPGGKLGAGSGSDKREAWFILSAMMKTNRETTLEVYEFTKEWNSWEDEVIGVFEDTQLTTLDLNPTGTEKTANV
tara:strand:- start:8180 stop:9529 length:1350 start_codon:yes stop_codon:yes gene_type:complete